MSKHVADASVINNKLYYECLRNEVTVVPFFYGEKERERLQETSSAKANGHFI